MIGRSVILHVLLLATIALAFSACEEDVAAPARMDQPFSMYGILNPLRDTQTVAVSPIEPHLHEYPQFIDAVATSTDMRTGEVVTWTDSVATSETGQLEHVFWAEMMPELGGDYLVEVRRSDGATASAMARVPSEIEVTYQDRTPRSLDVLVKGEDFRLVDIQVVYIARGYNIFSSDPCLDKEREYTLSYTNDEEPVDGGYRLHINPELDRVRLVDKYKINWIIGIGGLALTGIKVDVLVGDVDWNPPGGVLDSGVLSAVGSMTNVQSGFGLVTGGYRHERRIYPSADVIESTEFWDFMLRPPDECLDYCVCTN